MSATIIAFPRKAPASAAPRCAVLPNAVPVLCRGACYEVHHHFLPVVQASVDLLDADDVDFEARCRRMLDADSVAMIEDLSGELQSVGRQMKLWSTGLS